MLSGTSALSLLSGFPLKCRMSEGRRSDLLAALVHEQDSTPAANGSLRPTGGIRRTCSTGHLLAGSSHSQTFLNRLTGLQISARESAGSVNLPADLRQCGDEQSTEPSRLSVSTRDHQPRGLAPPQVYPELARHLKTCWQSAMSSRRTNRSGSGAPRSASTAQGASKSAVERVAIVDFFIRLRCRFKASANISGVPSIKTATCWTSSCKAARIIAPPRAFP